MEQKNALSLSSWKQWFFIVLVSILLLSTVALVYAKFAYTKTAHAQDDPSQPSTVRIIIHNSSPNIMAVKVSRPSGDLCYEIGLESTGGNATVSPVFGTKLTFVGYAGLGCVSGTTVGPSVTANIPAVPTFSLCDVYLDGKSATSTCPA